MVSSAILKKTRTSEFFKDYQNSTTPKDECYLRSMKNSRVRVFSKLHEKSCYYFVIIMTKLCRIVAYACVTCKLIYSLPIVNVFMNNINQYKRFFTKVKYFQKRFNQGHLRKIQIQGIGGANRTHDP